MNVINAIIKRDNITCRLLSLFKHISVSPEFNVKHYSNCFHDGCYESEYDEKDKLVSVFEGDCRLHSVNILTKVNRNDYEKFKRVISKDENSHNIDRLYYSYGCQSELIKRNNAKNLKNNDIFSYSTVEVVNFNGMEFYLIIKLALNESVTNDIQNVDISNLKGQYLQLSSFNPLKWNKASIESIPRSSFAITQLNNKTNDIYDHCLLELDNLTKELGIYRSNRESVTISLQVTRKEDTPYFTYNGFNTIKRDLSFHIFAYHRQTNTEGNKPINHCIEMHDVEKLFFNTKFDNITIINDINHRRYSEDNIPEVHIGLSDINIEKIMRIDIEKRLFFIEKILHESDTLVLSKITKKRKLLSDAILCIDRLQTEITIFSNHMDYLFNLRGSYKPYIVEIKKIKNIINEIDKLKIIISNKSKIFSDEISINNIRTQKILSFSVFALAIVQFISPVFEDSIKILSKNVSCYLFERCEINRPYKLMANDNFGNVQIKQNVKDEIISK